LVDLVAREAVIEISGAGDVHVHATESLTASVSGAGDVIYTGDPEEVNKDVSGAGRSGRNSRWKSTFLPCR
jgi:hypothetical protein